MRNKQLNIKYVQSNQDFSFSQEYVTSAMFLAKAVDILQGESNAYYELLIAILLAVRKKL